MQKKNVIGLVIMVAVILLSMPLGAWRSLHSARDKVVKVYRDDSTGYSIAAGLESRRESANSMITVARRYAKKYPELNPAIEDLKYRASLSTKRKDLTAAVTWNKELTQDMNALYDALGELPLSEQDARSCRNIMSEFETEQNKICNSSYNEDARAFNLQLEQFPAKLLRPILFLDELGTFDD